MAQPSPPPPPASSAPAVPAVPSDGSGVMFDAIAGRYDRLNRILSMGWDQGWRRATAAALELDSHPAPRVLDLATGTADLALEIRRRYPGATVVGIDPSQGMLEIGRQKVAAARWQSSIDLQTGDAQALPFEDGRFDAVTIAFGIRNVPDRRRGLAEMARVTRSGGRIAVLEASEPQGGLLAPLARFHIHKVVPTVGAMLSRGKAYNYLQDSIAAFPAPQEFATMMEAAGLQQVRIQPLTFGVCQLFVGEVP
jgi:demethylmenaquinone methyltransferase / 2-methoxy-6-polyprenyl-1,4-benzoquinol methylase